MIDRLYTISEMVEDFASYKAQIKALIKREGVPTGLVGKRTTVVDRAGYEAVRAAVERFRSRPILARVARGERASASA